MAKASHRAHIEAQCDRLAAHPNCDIFCKMGDPIDPSDLAQWSSRLRLPEATRTLYAELDGAQISWVQHDGPLAGINAGLRWFPLEQIVFEQRPPEIAEVLESMMWDSDDPGELEARISRRHLFEQAHVYEDAARGLEHTAYVWFEINGEEHVLYYLFGREFIELDIDFERYIECAITVLGYPFWQLLFARDPGHATRHGVSREAIVELFPDADALLP